MPAHKSHRFWIAAAFAGLLGVAGCEGGGGGIGMHRYNERAYIEESNDPIEKKQSFETVVQRVNDNSAHMDFLLRAGGVNTEGKYVENGKAEGYELKGTLLYRRPRDLYLQLQHSLGGKMEIGSNDREFWVWKRLGKDRYWWGEQRNVDANGEIDIPLRPSDIVEVLGLGELPRDQLSRASFKALPKRYEIRVNARDSRGRDYTAKAISVDRRPPYLVREMRYFYPDGQERMIAYLSRYGIVDGSSVYAPFRIEMSWPERGGNMDLEFASVRRFDSGEAASRFISPLQRGRDVGPMQRVDQPVQASAR